MVTPLESLSAFEMSKRTIATSISSGVESVSPGSSVKLIHFQSSPRTRPPLLPRATYAGTSVERIKIPSTGNGKEGTDASCGGRPPAEPERRVSGELIGGGLAKSSVAVTHGVEVKMTQPLEPSSLRSPRSLPDSTSTTPSIARKSRPRWVRSQSGSIWIHKHRSLHDDDSIISEASSIRKTVAKVPSGIIIMPLVPPTPPSHPGTATSRTSSVRIETPFQHMPDAMSTTSKQSNEPSLKQFARRTSLKAQTMLLSPLVAFNQLVREKRLNPPRSQPDPSSTPPPAFRDAQSHKSGLRKDQTSQVLNRVSSLLAEVAKPANFAKGLRVRTRESLSTPSSLDPTEPRQEKPNRGITASFNIFKNKSLEVLPTMKTATSSILDVQMGSTPLNSPLEVATYKVKRSPSQETEEFLKIDISIRGGTSYLPSEARRIHTPPLAEDNQRKGLHKRGFFFDYFPPKLHEGESFVQQDQSQSEDIARRKSTPKPQLDQTLTVKRQGSSYTKPSHLSSQRTNSAISKNGDWYETQLADLDSLIPDTEVNLSQQISHTSSSDKARHEHQARLRDVRKQQYFDELDWTIPEHLPSSPLCPRHPRY